MTGRPADPGLDTDLATLREFVGTHDDPYDGDTSGVFALQRVEAELSRLREERDEWHRIADDNLDRVRNGDLRNDAAEAECARLRQALLGLGWDIGLPELCWCDDGRWDRDPEDGSYPYSPNDPDEHSDQCKAAREALAGPDTPADKCAEHGQQRYSGCPVCVDLVERPGGERDRLRGDTPADSPKEACPGCGGDAGDNHFDRSLCPCGDGSGTMHTYCNTCGYALDGCGFQPVIKPADSQPEETA